MTGKSLGLFVVDFGDLFGNYLASPRILILRSFESNSLKQSYVYIVKIGWKSMENFILDEKPSYVYVKGRMKYRSLCICSVIAQDCITVELNGKLVPSTKDTVKKELVFLIRACR